MALSLFSAKKHYLRFICMLQYDAVALQTDDDPVYSSSSKT